MTELSRTLLAMRRRREYHIAAIEEIDREFGEVRAVLADQWPTEFGEPPIPLAAAPATDSSEPEASDDESETRGVSLLESIRERVLEALEIEQPLTKAQLQDRVGSELVAWRCDVMVQAGNLVTQVGYYGAPGSREVFYATSIDVFSPDGDQALPDHQVVWSGAAQRAGTAQLELAGNIQRKQSPFLEASR